MKILKYFFSFCLIVLGYFISILKCESAYFKYPDRIFPCHKNGNNLLVNVNKKYRLPKKYVPKNLIKLNDLKEVKYYILDQNHIYYARKIIIEDLINLLNDAEKSNIKLIIFSAYRGYNYQKYLYKNYCAKFGKKEANKFSAKPGHSQHQLGTAVDFTCPDCIKKNGQIDYNIFEKTKACNWLKDNAFKYGFTLSYPKNKVKDTGYIYEPWHYRYIGKENAQKMQKKGEIQALFLQNILREVKEDN